MNQTMILRLIILVILIAALTIGSALLIGRKSDMVDAISPCEQPSNLGCQQ